MTYRIQNWSDKQTLIKLYTRDWDKADKNVNYRKQIMCHKKKFGWGRGMIDSVQFLL